MPSRSRMKSPLYRLHIRLDQVEPAVERTLVVPSDLRLDRLHAVIQVVMGWQDEHLHEFRVGRGRRAQRFAPRHDGTFDFDAPPRDEAAHTLADIAPRAGSRLDYLYDFGDGWSHRLTVECLLERASTATPLHCLSASGACPPEDCGGPFGYAHLLEALADPGHEDHDDLREWVGDRFDPAAWDLDAVNAALARLARRWKLTPAATDAAANTGNTDAAPAPARAEGATPDGAPGRSGTASLVAVASAGRTGARGHKTFNRLIGEIERKRAELADWQAWLAGFAERMAGEYTPLLRQRYGIELRLVRQLDHALGPGAPVRLRKTQRVALQHFLAERLHDLLDAGGPAEEELAALLHTHTGEDFGQLREQEREFEKAMAESMLGDIFGEDLLQGHEAEDAEALFRHVGERLRERETDETHRARASGKRAQAEREASQSMRELFRKLTSTLHPDREPDPAARARKTALMQQVNRAYRENDLLQLLTLQLQIEQIDADDLVALPADRLRHYNAVLRDQAAALDAEIDELLQSVAMEMDLPPGVRPRRGELDHALRDRIEHARQACTQAEADIAALDDPGRLDVMIRRLQAQARMQQAEFDIGMAELELMFGMHVAPHGGRRAPSAAAKKKRKTRTGSRRRR